MSTHSVIPEIERKDVGQSVPPSPPSQHPQLPPPRPNGNRWTWIAIVAIAFVLLLSLGTLLYVQVGRPGGQPTPTPSGNVSPTQPGASTPKATQPAVTPQPSATQVPGNATTPAPAATVKWGPQACPAGASDPARWASLIGIKGSSMKIEGISYANVIGDPSLQAMVTVRHTDTLRTLDVYAFDRITSTHPVRLLKLTGLTLGDAKISSYNTIMTAEADLSSPVNKGKPEGGLTRDLFREFAWRSDQQALTQVAFPGFFPDLTRYQAEADQALVNRHVDTWKNDPTRVAKELAKKFFKWDRNVTATVVSGGGAKDVSATVKVVEAAIQGAGTAPTVNVRLSRLEGNIQNMWVVIGVEDTNMLTVTNIGARSLVSSPVLVTGKGAAFEAVIGNAFVLDHLYNDSGHARVQASGSSGMGIVPYMTRVTYATTFTKGVQEGIIEVQASNGGISSDVQSAVMVKVLLNPASAPAPDVKNPRYWDAIVGAKAGVSRVASVTLASLKGDSSQQAIVTRHVERKAGVQQHLPRN